MSNKIISIGHINPDTDSVLSAIVLSRYAKKMAGEDRVIEARIAGTINNETKFVLERLKIAIPEQITEITNEDVALVDTTEPAQMIKGINENNLFAIIDHHNLGGLKSSKPIFVRIEPVGCTATVIYRILKENKVKIDKTSAIMMLSSIISDTLNLTSPTTNLQDEKALKELNKIAKLNLKKFTKELFAAKSSLEGISIDDIITKDYKQFDMGASKVGIAVWETTSPESVNIKKEEITSALLRRKAAENLNYAFFMAVDILKSESALYIIAEAEKMLAEKVFGGKAEKGAMLLKDVVSRKKQIVPPLMSELTK